MSKSKTRSIVWDKTQGHCLYCGKKLHPFRDFHVDHFFAKKGSFISAESAFPPHFDGDCKPWPGYDIESIWNLVPSCSRCNIKKATKHPAEFMAFWLEDTITSAYFRWIKQRLTGVINIPFPAYVRRNYGIRIGWFADLPIYHQASDYRDVFRDLSYSDEDKVYFLAALEYHV